MKRYLGNSFSLQMVPREDWDNSTIDFRVRKIETDKMAEILSVEPVETCIGHADTGAVLTTILGVEIPCNRKAISLNKGDVLYVAQIMGGRLPEGTTTLPENFEIIFLEVQIV